MSRRVPLPEPWPPVAGGPPVLRPLPGDPGITSAAAVVGGGRLVIGVARHGGTGSGPRPGAVHLRVHQVSPVAYS